MAYNHYELTTEGEIVGLRWDPVTMQGRWSDDDPANDNDHGIPAFTINFWLGKGDMRQVDADLILTEGL